MTGMCKAELQAVQLFRGDLAAGETITFSQTYNAFLGMYQVSPIRARRKCRWLTRSALLFGELDDAIICPDGGGSPMEATVACCSVSLRMVPLRQW
jgi:hypothetical protein